MIQRLALLLALAFPALGLAQKPRWTPPPAERLVTLIADNPKEAAALIRASWGPGSLAEGKNKHVENTTVLWAYLGEDPVSAHEVGRGKLGDLVRLDDEGLQALALDVGNCREFNYELRKPDGEALSGGHLKIESYPDPPEVTVGEGIPAGRVTRHEWKDSKIYPGTTREYEVYIPAQLEGGSPAALLVFQDGLRHAAREGGGLRVPNVVDNLIAEGAMPPTIGIFINPGRKAGQKPGEKPANRSFEYDSLGDQYVRFLLEEIIPQVVEEHGVNLSEDPAMWAIAGGSSGCACAWTAAWERPDRFGKVLGWVGTFTDIRGAHAYPSTLVRKTRPAKPIRAALLGENNDLDNQYGNWPLANRQMESALRYSEYDHRYWWGDGFHGSRHAAAMLPEMLRWLYRDWKRQSL